ncbi:MAG: transposase [Verrucomicrobiota bacterium]
MSLTLAQLLTEHWPAHAQAHRSKLSTAHYRAVRAVLSCRTPALGGQLYRCQKCQKLHFAYHSCNHRSCPQCGSMDQQIWTAKREAQLLPGVPYYLITFTLPDTLRPSCLAHPRSLYSLLLTESAGALRDVVHTKTGADTIAITSVLHTWGRQMQYHPHVHCVVPAIGYQNDTDQLIEPKNSDKFLVHFRPLAARFRSRIESALRERYPDIYNQLSTEARRSLGPKTQWNVQLQPVGKGHTAIRYLARYVHRSAFHPSRLLGYDKKGKVMLRWKCSLTDKVGVLHLSPPEFIRRWLIHVLPKRFTRVRHYGFASSAAKRVRLRIRWLLGACLDPQPVLPELEPFRCPSCSGLLKLEASILPIRAPRGPPITRCR